MSINFHCESCKKKIKAPDKTGGKWGNCPHCSHKCYVPLPSLPEEEELTLAPLDEADEVEYKEKMRETRNITQNILHEVEGDEAGGVFDEAEEKKLTVNIISYLRLMADGMLDEAEVSASRIGRFKLQALRVLSEIESAKEKPGELAEIAPGVLFGMVKKLRSQLE